MIRRALYVELDPGVRLKRGLSWLNVAISLSILGAVILAILETEPVIATGRERLFDHLEIFFGVFFSAEYVARIWTVAENPKYGDGWRGRFRYALTPAALFDAVAIIASFTTPTGLRPYMLRLLRLLRIIRLAKLGRTTTAMGFLVSAILKRRDELLFSLYVGVFFLLLSATCLYFVEGSVQPDKFGSIPRAMWWATATLTTIGYGDVYPVTPLGKVLAGVCAIAGIGLVAMPTGIMAAAFSDAVQKHSEGRLALERRERIEAVRAMAVIANDLIQQASRELHPGKVSAGYLSEGYSPEALADAIHTLEQLQLLDLGDFDLTKQTAILRRFIIRAKRGLDKMTWEATGKGIPPQHIESFQETAGRMAETLETLSARITTLDHL